MPVTQDHITVSMQLKTIWNILIYHACNAVEYQAISYTTEQGAPSSYGRHFLSVSKSLLFLAVQTQSEDSSGRRGRVKTIVFISIKGVLYILALIVHDDCYAKVLRPPAQLCWEEYSCRGQRFWLGNAVVDSCTTQPPWIYSTKVSYFHSFSSTISDAVDFQHFLHSYEKGFWKVEAAQIKPVFCRLLIVLRLTL